MKSRLIFITGTDTGVGKTVATAVLGILLQQRGIKVGVFKPVQCAGDDALFLKKTLGLDDPLELINPIFAPEALSPHLALRRLKIKFDLSKIKRNLKQLVSRYEIVLIEGAGGLMVPLKENYYTADLVRDLKAELIIVSRLGLGTINHSLLTINQAKAYPLKIKGILFSDSKGAKKSLPEQTNAQEIARLSKIKVLGSIPFLTSFKRNDILKSCRHIKLKV